ncbi:MAG: cbb3-type cytochrome c oxidase subunit I [Thioalkalivibrio sp.]|nr:cbb3-type cytochrome c oxidase subunit I [Thioalkalivibrio sp.]
MATTAEETSQLASGAAASGEDAAARTSHRLALWNMWIGFAAFALALPMGLYQIAVRSGLFPAIQSDTIYAAAVSTHGVLMAYVLSTFFIMGFGYHTAYHTLRQRPWSPAFAWTGFWIATLGVVLAASALLTNRASVMYTFYPPEMADASFYFGVALFVVGSWFWCVNMIVEMVRWKKANPGRAVPLIMFGTAINALLWLWTSLGATLEVLFQLIPVSMGWIDTLDPGLARTLFSWTLHAIVYFWLIPAYLVMYSILPKEAGGYLFSDEMARIAFVMLFIFSVPIGFHHLYMDPQQAAGWKLLHMFGTFMVAVPTFITGFTVIASLELSGRLRGGKGLFGWIGKLKWNNPVVLAGILALLMLTFGGFGGVINASYAMNAAVHNTGWVPAHFHLIYGGTTVIMYFAAAYWLWPKITGRKLWSTALSNIQLWMWFVGMWIVTAPWHVIGLMGQPRRTSDQPYDSPIADSWVPYEVLMIFGAALLVLSGLLFIVILLETHRNRVSEPNPQPAYATAVHQPLAVPKLLNSLAFWSWAMLAYMLISYGYPILQFFFLGTPGSMEWGY